MDQFHTLVLPVSGGAFVNQAGIYLHLKKLGYVPDAILGSSGGSVCLTLLVASEITADFETFKERVLYRSSKMSSNDLIKKTNGSVQKVVTVIHAISHPYIHERGPGIPEEILDFEVHDKPELWIATTCNEDGREMLWTNRNDSTLYPGVHGLLRDTRSSVGVFKGTKELIDVVMASTAMQGYLPPYKIHGIPYSDPGILAVSPLQGLAASFTSASLLGVEGDQKRSQYNIVYIAPRDIFAPTSIYLDAKNVLGSACDSFAQLYISFTIYDATLAISLLGDGACHKILYREGNTDKSLARSLKKANQAERSIIYLMPEVSHEVSIFDFQQGDLSKAIESVYTDGYKFKHWYIPK